MLKLFRDVEHKIIGDESPKVRSKAKEESRLERTGQNALFNVFEEDQSSLYDRHQVTSKEKLKSILVNLENEQGPLQFEEIKPHILEQCHMTESEARRLLWAWKSEGMIKISGIRGRERSIKDYHVISETGHLTSKVEPIQKQHSFDI